MGIRTDLTSLGAIGLGTAVAVVGTGALLFAGVSHDANVSYCVDVPSVTAITAVPAVPDAPAPPVSVAEVSVDVVADAPTVVEVSDAVIALERLEALEVVKAPRVNVVVSDRIHLRSECVAEYEERLVDIRVRALEQAESARARAGEARNLANEIREIAAEIRAEADANGEVDAERIQELVEAALADAGIRRGGSWGN